MRASYAGCAILAPTLISAAAFALPEPTQHFSVAVDYWVPEPTAAPQLGFDLFGREAEQTDQRNTCGYISGLSASSITCPNSKEICATNNFYGVHGCCDASDISSCIIATTCIASTAMSSLCTNDACSSERAIAKCTRSTAMECYKWLFVYERTTMKQYGCTASGFTSTAQRSYGPLTASLPSATMTVTALESPMTTPTDSSHGESKKKQSLGPIVGGTVGGCVIVSLVALAAFLVHHRRAKQQFSSSVPANHYQHNSPEFDPSGFQTCWNEQDAKTLQQSGGMHRPGMPYIGVSEIHGDGRAVEVEAPANNKSGMLVVTESGLVEVEATVGDERKMWRGPVEAPTEVDR